MMRPRIDAGLGRLALTALLGTIAWAGCDSGEELLGNGDGNGNGDEVRPEFSSLYDSYLSGCAQCHAPGARGASREGIEQTLNFETRATAYDTVVNGAASGLQGNEQGCNGAPFVTAGKPLESLLLAVLVDPEQHGQFGFSSAPSCGAPAITDEAQKMGRFPSAAFLDALRTWIEEGAPND